MNTNNKKIVFIMVVCTLIFILLVCIGFNFISNRDVIKTSGIKVYYRVYTNGRWSKWYKNGQIAGIENSSIKAVEAKIKTNKNGHILYNTYSSSNDFNDNDTYDGEMCGNQIDSLYGIRFSLSDEVYNKYRIYYRTHNKKDKWMGWTSDYLISGDNEVEIDQLQIKVILREDTFDGYLNNSSIGF
ncbi:MAG: hypothetical protein IIZ40_04890 [Bacilli bacterium]|nr:hypothetical protein [Bacilli bacterium]